MITEAAPTPCSASPLENKVSSTTTTTTTTTKTTTANNDNKDHRLVITAAAWKTIEKDDFAKTCKIFKKVSLAQFPLRVWRTKQEQIFPASKLGSLEDKERAISY